MIPENPYVITASVAVVAQAVYAVRWITRRIRQDENKQQVERVTRKFVADMATNHLPHVYRTESLLGEGINRLLRAQGLEEIKLEEHPPIQWVDLSSAFNALFSMDWQGQKPDRHSS